ncbi:MAG TPA: penicillin acylase family protein [Micromonosporaceae bacterium]
MTKFGLVTVLVIVVVAAVLGVWTVRRAVPQYGGQLRLEGLAAPVTVHRDTAGIPHIYASSAADMVRAQGYLHAQDRFWEMDFRRHVTAGRLAEIFGKRQVKTDAYLRTMGWRRVAEQEWRLLRPRTRHLLLAYAGGVNAWLADHSGSEASLEYALLGVLNPDYQIERWHPIDTLAWLKAMAWDLRTNLIQETDRAVLLGAGLTREQIDRLYPPYPVDRHAPIVPEPTLDDGVAGDTPDVMPAALRHAAPLFEEVGRALHRLPSLFGSGDGIGSNSWVLAGSRTASGKPILANDPHLAPSMPGIWYQVGLHCAPPQGRTGNLCPSDVVGFSFSGVPGVIIGHNARIAWGFTNLGPDVTDLYLEKTDGDRYLVDGRWHSMRVRTDTIKVAGGKAVTIRIRHTRHGPVLSDHSPELATIGTTAGLTREESRARYAVALRWTALDPGRTAEAVMTLNTARDWTDFRAAARTFEVPAQNLVYADVDGNIGYQAPGRIPIRGTGDGRWPVPGWDSRYEWRGYIPFQDLPSELNPSRGYIVTANQAVVGPDYPYLITRDWSYGYRSQRIIDLITRHTRPIDVTATEGMQFDNHNGGAPVLVPHLLRVAVPQRARQARDLLVGWDFQQPAGSAPAAFYNAVWRHVLLRTFEELPAKHRPNGNDRWFEVLRDLLTDPDSPWWDDQRTRDVEHRDDILSAAVANAHEDLAERLGQDPQQWRWGDLHTLTLRNATFGTSGIGPVEWLFNSGPYPVAGGGGIVNATAWDADAGYQVTAVPSMRMIVDLADLDNSRWVQLTGNSGHAFDEHYTDQFELWRTGRYLPMRFSRDTVVDKARHLLLLTPR